MRLLRRHRRAGLAFALGAACAAALTWSAAEHPAQAEPAPFTVSSTLPRWLARTGDSFRGTASPAEAVTLFVGGTQRTKTTGGDGTSAPAFIRTAKLDRLTAPARDARRARPTISPAHGR
jgi:hypothetical protein